MMILNPKYKYKMFYLCQTDAYCLEHVKKILKQLYIIKSYLREF